MFADSEGWISAVGKTITLRAQFKAAESIVYLGSMQSNLVIGMKEAIAFSDLNDDIVNGLCEYT